MAVVNIDLFYEPTCFVIQPFDNGRYDKRFKDVYSPAIEAASLKPYRVDKDPGVAVPIDAIESGIRNAEICLADITTDNPNVWYELGYAFACSRPVVMVCANERTKYPFDIQHRTIIPYHADSLSDFTALQAKITENLSALLTNANTFRKVVESKEAAPLSGLSNLELAVIAATADQVSLPGDSIAAYRVESRVQRAGFTTLAFSLGVKRLVKKELIALGQGLDLYSSSEPYPAISVTEKGWDWIENNEDMFTLRRPLPPEPDF